jgi:hypothetical protein
MDDVRDAFEKVISDRLDLVVYILDQRVSGNTLTLADSRIRRFQDLCNELARHIELNRTNDFTQFIRDNDPNIVLMSKTLIKETNYDKDLQFALKRLHDRIKIALNYNTIIKGDKARVTAVFTEFAKGITYFRNETENQEMRWPVYHRNASCGSKQKPSEYRFLRTLYGDDQGKYVERCYIERLVYDELFNKISGLQNLDHLFELDRIARYHEDYFPSTMLRVAIRYNANDEPYRLTIDEHDVKTKSLLRKSVFTKQQSTQDVACTKYDFQNDEMFEKRQTFDHYVEWVSTGKFLDRELSEYQ